MLASSVKSLAHPRRVVAKVATQATRAKGTQVDKSGSEKGPLGKDGRHEIWREGIYDHDNEPK
jgi:hypothetical protein